MARKTKKKNCKGLNKRTGKLKKGFRWGKHGCPVHAKKK